MPKKKKSQLPLILLIIGIVLSVFIYKKYQPKKTYHFHNLPELPEGFKSYGIDVSHHQGTIDWNTFFNACDSSISFVFCKATEGIEFIDEEFENNAQALLDHNKKFSAYHFFLPKPDPIQQANHFISVYKNYEGQLPPVLDAETEGDSDTELIKNMKTWLEHVELKTGKRPIIYTSYNFYNEKFKDHFKGYKYWVANYSDKAYRFKDDNILYWQFSDNGKIPGIQKPVDLNYSKIEFLVD